MPASAATMGPSARRLRRTGASYQPDESGHIVRRRDRAGRRTAAPSPGRGPVRLSHALIISTCDGRLPAPTPGQPPLTNVINSVAAGVLCPVAQPMSITFVSSGPLRSSSAPVEEAQLEFGHQPLVRVV